MTKCLSKWIPTAYGAHLHPECFGCARRTLLGQPVSAETKQPPEFDEWCQLKETEDEVK